jgi:hypothetical protein
MSSNRTQWRSLGRHWGVIDVRRHHGLTALPIWNTEGAPTRTDDATEEEARAAVARTYLMMPILGVERFYWYTWDIFGFGNR